MSNSRFIIAIVLFFFSTYLLTLFMMLGYSITSIDKNNNYQSIIKDDKVKGSFTTNLDVLDRYYLALSGNKKIEYSFNYPENYKVNIDYTIEDENIIKVENDIIYGLNVGDTKLTIILNDGNRKEINITVTDLITEPQITENKEYLPCERYTVEEAELLDKILESRVKEYGYKTRGGVLAAARFITLEFPYTIRYFNENGRLVNHNIRPHIDGEGRYYHKGLYLNKEKFKDLEPNASTKTGPAIWGCKIYDSFVSRYNSNGFTCSGFVTWAMLNGGFDVGDVGAGDYPQFNDDLSDLGTHHEITKEYIKNGSYKVGDFIGRQGHAALIIGIDDDYIYTAESLPPKLKVYKYSKDKIDTDDNLTYIIEMSSIYPNGDGFTTNMW